jgi:hypothetical protein
MLHVRQQHADRIKRNGWCRRFYDVTSGRRRPAVVEVDVMVKSASLTAAALGRGFILKLLFRQSLKTRRVGMAV